MLKLAHPKAVHLDSIGPSSEFFVETTSFKESDDGRERDGSFRNVPFRHAVTKSESFAQADLLAPHSPEIDLQLVSRRLLHYVIVASVFYTVFTSVFYVGIKVDTVLEAIGTSKKSEELAETFNTYSGYVMALVEVFVAMNTENILPVLNVYVHNALFFMQRGPDGQPKSTTSRRLHTVIVVAFPIVLSLTLGNSLRGLQAVQSSAGVERIMSADDMKKEAPMLELIKAKAKKNSTNATNPATVTLRGVNDIILKNAIRQQATPFTFDTNSSCGEGNNATKADDTPQTATKFVKLNTHELDSTSVVYGFVPQEWNSEAITMELVPISAYAISYRNVTEAREKSEPFPQPKDFSTATAYEMLVQGKIMIERAYGIANVSSYPCSDSYGNKTVSSSHLSSEATTPRGAKARKRKLGAYVRNAGKRRLQDHINVASAPSDSMCEGAVTSLFRMESFYNRKEFKAEDLVIDATNVIARTIAWISRNETEIILEKYDLTPQIHIEAMRIDMPMNVSVKYGLEGDCEDGNSTCDLSVYSYDLVQESFCGSNNCAFLDMSDTFPIQRVVGAVPYMTNCSLDAGHIQYSPEFRGFYPTDCKKVPNTALVYGFGTFISGDEYGGDDTTIERNSGAPYIKKPRRHIRFTFAKISWETANLAEAFNATCGVSNCSGLWYQLQPSGRFLFAGEAALSTKKLEQADFKTPIPLVQLNSPTLYIDSLEAQVTLERIVKGKNFMKIRWEGEAAYNGSALGGGECSMLMDSYLKQVETNNYFLERPLQAMYTSFFYYLMENASVTQLNDTSLALGGGNVTASTLKNDKLGNVKLKGDQQMRSIRVSIPSSAFFTTLAGCIVILVMMVVILVVPARRVEYFDEDTTKAQQFMVMREDDKYPGSVLSKTLLFPVTNESVPFNDVEIERVALVHVAERDRMVYL